MNAEYSGNATYEHFERDENGNTIKTEWFERLKEGDKRLENKALFYLFEHPELTIKQALKEIELK